MNHRTTPTGHDPTLTGICGPFICEIASTGDLTWSEEVFRLIRVSGQDCEAIWHVP
jgi:hypothetical protein